MVKIFDFVEVLDHQVKEMVGAKGIVLRKVLDEGYYEIVFVGSKHNRISQTSGGCIFKDEDLRVI